MSELGTHKEEGAGTAPDAYSFIYLFFVRD
jgi:hypothetical protein